MFCDSSPIEGLGFKLCVVPADSLSPSISLDLSVGFSKGLRGRR